MHRRGLVSPAVYAFRRSSRVIAVTICEEQATRCMAGGAMASAPSAALHAEAPDALFRSVAEFAGWVENSMSIVPEPALVLSHYQARPLLAARAAGATSATSSPDLGLTVVDVGLRDEGVLFPDITVDWRVLAEIATSENACYLVTMDVAEPIRVYSEATGWVRGLMPTAGAPTTLVSGITMHRIQGIDPWHDTERKIRAAAPLTGRALDTATGLGYTALLAARSAAEVITIELDPAALEIARLNPWSRELFENPKISRVIGDAFEEVQRFPDGHFSVIIHDPPMLNMAGELYSLTFYRELRRILARRGRLFHYIGDPDSGSGRTTTRGVIRRLQEAGFQRITRRPEAFGVLAE